ncbi:hypothetical protein D3C86_1393150 [compost metagenome]
MQVDQVIGARQQDCFNVMGNDLGRRSSRVAGEQAIEVAIVQWRSAQTGSGGRVVHHRQQNDLALDHLRLQLANQARDQNLPFVFVAMAAGADHKHRALAIADRHHRNRNPAIGRAMHRVRQAQVAVMFARCVEIHVALDGVCNAHIDALIANGVWAASAARFVEKSYQALALVMSPTTS